MAKTSERRRLPSLDACIIRDENALTEALDELLHHSRRLQRGHRRILRQQAAIHRRVDDRVWRALLQLEQAQVARFSDSLDLVAKWAFAAGRRIGRKRQR